MAAKSETCAKTCDISSFVKKQLKLLDLERNAEIEESVDARRSGNIKELEKRGICVTKLYITSECTGLYGKHLVNFGRGRERKSKGKGKTKQENKDQFISHCLSNGDIIGVQTSSSELKEDNIASGIVTKATDDTITVAFEEEFESSSSFDTFKLVKLCNDVTYKRLKIALETLSNAKKISHLKDVLFHQTALGVPLRLLKEDRFNQLDSSLNELQVEAVKFALNQKEIGIIHGPPGTGKTTTVIEVIRQAVKHFNFKILACAPSNVAVDNLVAKLAADSKIKIVRLGHPARVYPHLQKYSLDAVLMSSDSAEIVKNVRHDIQQILEKIKKSKNGTNTRKLRGELKYLKKELLERERKAIQSVLSSADVILSTTTSASAEGPLRHLNVDHFDLIVIDEAAQALEASCWIPLSNGNRCILAGDHQQLPPTIISHEAAKKGLEVTLMERAIMEFGDSIVRMLTTQYRMHNLIMSWPSKQLYNGKLTADDTVKGHLLSDLHGVTPQENTLISLLFIDTAGCSMYELKQESEESKGNESEVELVAHHVEALVNAGVKEEFIGIITPYNLQVELLRQALLPDHPKLEIRSVDGFQGREKEAIIISLVRSNDKGEVGFLKEDRRINVAITRARRHLAVIGDSSTISHHPFLKSFFDYVSDHGEVRSAQIYRQGAVGHDNEGTADELLKGFEALRGPSDALGAKRDPSVDAHSMQCETFNTAKSAHTASDLPPDSDTKSDERHENVKDFSRTKHAHIEANDQAAEKSQYTKKDIEDMVTDFVSSESKDTLSFDSSLGSQGRYWVHELAEKYNLAHWSTGEGRDRCISIKKRTKKRNNVNDGSCEESNICPNCSKEIPKQNLELHALRCTKVEKGGATKQKQFPKEDCKRKFAAKINKKDKKKAEEEDVDALIAQFTKDDSICSFEKCKTGVLTLGQKCKFCVRTFCLKHGLAEVHGCAEAAKVDARRSFERNAGKSRTKPLNDIQKNYVKKKLNEKIGEMEKKRIGSNTKKK